MKTTVPLGSAWTASDGRIFRVIEKHPFGLVTIKQDGRAYFGTVSQKSLKANFTPQLATCQNAHDDL